MLGAVVALLVLYLLVESRGYRPSFGWFNVIGIFFLLMPPKFLAEALEVRNGGLLNLGWVGVLFVVGLLIVIAMPVKNRPD